MDEFRNILVLLFVCCITVTPFSQDDTLLTDYSKNNTHDLKAFDSLTVDQSASFHLFNKRKNVTPTGFFLQAEANTAVALLILIFLTTLIFLVFYSCLLFINGNFFRGPPASFSYSK